MAGYKYYNEPATNRLDYNLFYTLDATTLMRSVSSTFVTINSYDAAVLPAASGRTDVVIQSSASQNGMEPVRFTTVTMETDGTFCGGTNTTSLTIEAGTTETAIGPGQSTTETFTTNLDTSLDSGAGATITPNSGCISQSSSHRLQYQTIYDNKLHAHLVSMGVQKSDRSTVLNCS